MEYLVRGLRPEETPVLEDLLYEAIFVPEGTPPPPREIVRQEALQVYVRDFGTQRGDYCLAADLDGQIIGAVWVRIMDDYGHIDNETPSLAIALYPQYRGMGIGARLMHGMLQLLQAKKYHRVSLSVQKANRAAGLYRSLGFRTIREDAEEAIMVCDLSREFCPV